MRRNLIAYAAALVVFLVIDLPWFGWIAADFYAERLAPFMTGPVRVEAAVAFYLLYVVGIVVFAIAPALETGAWTTAAFRGALFGLIAYATFELTNLAILPGWPLSVVLVDMVWGAVLTGSTATLGFLITRRFS
ncbi:MAG: DUF2177 family protein [Kiloniellales bacterium]|nr:DUF2177 family protein [Kiloniellales bacterium]